MVEATLRVVANALFSEDFGPLVHSMNDLATRGLRRTEKFGRLGLWGLMPRSVYKTLMWCTFSGVPLPPPFRESQQITLALDEAVNAVLDDRVAYPTESADLLNVLFSADNGTWPRKRVRDEALTFMLAGHETTANAMSWLWYLLASNPDAREKVLAEIDDVLGGRRPTAADLARLPWPDPDTFDPTRFIGDVVKDRPRSAYLPFGGGRRICIGQSFALMEMVLMAAVMSQRFTFDVCPDHGVELEATLTLRPKHGLRVVAHRREESADERSTG